MEQQGAAGVEPPALGAGLAGGQQHRHDQPGAALAGAQQLQQRSNFDAAFAHRAG